MKLNFLKRLAIRVAILIVALLVIGYGFRDFWFRQIRIYLIGLEEVRAEELGYRLPDVDEVEVASLGNPDYDAPKDQNRIGPYVIIQRVTLNGAEP